MKDSNLGSESRNGDAPDAHAYGFLTQEHVGIISWSDQRLAANCRRNAISRSEIIDGFLRFTDRTHGGTQVGAAA